jgi:hypothetical protein
LSDQEQEIVIDLTQSLNESYLTAMGTGIKLLLNALFRGSYLPVRVKGTKSQFDSFMRALSAEKRYITSFNNNGLNNAATYRSKHVLDQAVSKFEKDTGMIWPFK